MPVALVAVAHEFAVDRESAERFSLEERFVVIDVVEHPPVQDEESAIDPTLLGLGLLAKLANPVAIEVKSPESGGGSHRGDGANLPVLAMEG